MLTNLKSPNALQGRRLRSVALLEEVSDAYTRKDWARLRTLYHDDARLCTMAAREAVVGPDEVIETFKNLAGTVYSIGKTAVFGMDDDAVKVVGRLRYPLENGGMGDSEITWLLTFKDDLLYRSRPYKSRAAARAAYAEHGITLGL